MALRRGISLLILIGLILSAHPAFAQATNATSSPSASDIGPLNIHVTAVQGGAQFRQSGEKKWQNLAANTDFIEGVEFRTGPRGTIQFTVGTDQVFRIDRLSAVKMLRANLMPDGTIRTDLGMTYGRVSKDVDTPARVHDDHIVTPSSTLAVRGTRVSMFDSPPYEPQATSLTGTGVLSSHNRASSVAFGSKGGGTVTLAGDAPNAAQGKLQNIGVNPLGGFSGQPPTGAGPPPVGPPPGAPPLPTGPPPPIHDTPGQSGGKDVQMMLPPTTVTTSAGGLGFFIDWSSTTPQTIVDLAVTSPTNEVVSPIHPTTPSGAVYYGPNIASSIPDPQTGLYFGKQGAIFGATTTPGFPNGTYTITETLRGPVSSGSPPGGLNGIVVNSMLYVYQTPTISQSSTDRQDVLPIQLNGPAVILNSATPSAVLTVKAPLVATSTATLISGIYGGGGGGTVILGGGSAKKR